MALSLVAPEKQHEQAWVDILKEYGAHGEKPSYGLHMACGIHEFDEYLKKDRDYREGRNLPESFPPKSVYFLMADDSQKILGHVTIRHSLNEYLFDTGGHVGYGIRPLERGKGYGTKQLALALDICKAKGIQDVLLICNSGNYASAAVIKKNGGEFDNLFIEPDGTILERYWVYL